MFNTHYRLTRRGWCIRNIVVFTEHFSIVVYLPKDETNQDDGMQDTEEGTVK